jgi:hypothetical protein
MKIIKQYSPTFPFTRHLALILKGDSMVGIVKLYDYKFRFRYFLCIFFSHRIGRTYPGPPPEVEALDQN